MFSPPSMDRLLISLFILSIIIIPHPATQFSASKTMGKQTRKFQNSPASEIITSPSTTDLPSITAPNNSFLYSKKLFLSTNTQNMTLRILEIPSAETTSLHYIEQLTLCKTPQDTSQQSSLYNEAFLPTERHVILTIRDEFHLMIQVSTNSNMVNMRPLLSKNSNNLPINTLNINIDPTLQFSTDITLTNNELPKSPYQENMNLLTHISSLIPGTIRYKLVTTS